MMGRQFVESLKKAEPSINLERPECRKYVLTRLGKEIVSRMMGSIVIMSTAIVASVLLIHRKGISEDQLIKTVTDITKYILKKGHRVGGVNENSSAAAVRNAIGYLSGITKKSKKNIFELTISAGDEFHKTLMLSYYRNTLTHAFLPEAFVACALSAFGDQLSLKEGIPLARAHAQSAFLARLLREEYFLEYSLEDYSEFMRAVRLMADNQIVELLEGDRVVISPRGTMMVRFYCSLLRPQVESYWASLVYIKTIAKSQESRQESSSLDKFFDTVQWFMESLYGEKVIEDYEACSRELIKNAFEKFQKLKVVRLTAGGKKREAVIEILADAAQIEALENEIKFFRRNAVSSVLSPMEVAKSSMKELALSKL
jgi:glycerol-3-phosphate O-acyltransferase